MDTRKSVVVSATTLEENFIRREKKRKLETTREIARMRAELPEYDLNHIRQFKLPFHEALLLHLEETGYVNTEGYINQLFKLQEQDRNEAGPSSNTWNLPQLKHSDNELRKLSDALMKAEDQHNSENYGGETETLLRVAIDFSFNYTDWFWLGKQLLMQCIHIASLFKATGKHEAIVRYVYAKALIEKVKDYETAEEQLNITRELSTGKSWNTKEFLPTQNDSMTLFMNANYLLHLCYLRQARYYFKTDQQKALEYAILAKKRANEACFHDGETTALLIKGQCELNLCDTKNAVSTFNKAYYIQMRLKSDKGMCEARVELSKAYLMHGNTRLALQNLMALKQMAEEHGFQFYLAQAYRYLGEYYLNNGNPCRATPLLSEALNIFHDTHNMAEADQVRNLEALSAGLEFMPEYITLIQKTDRRSKNWFDNLMKLVKWKDSREPFTIPKCVLSEKHVSAQTDDSSEDMVLDYFQAESEVEQKEIGTQSVSSERPVEESLVVIQKPKNDFGIQESEPFITEEFETEVHDLD